MTLSIIILLCQILVLQHMNLENHVSRLETYNWIQEITFQTISFSI